MGREHWPKEIAEDGLADPLCSVDARNSRIGQAVHISEGEIRGNVYAHSLAGKWLERFNRLTGN